MKLFLGLAAFLASTNLFASTANLYRCSGTDVEVYMTTTSLLGEPGLSVHTGSGEDRTSVSLNPPEVLESNLGLQVTASIANIADATISYTLIVPSVNIANADSESRTLAGVQGMLVQSVAGGLMAPDANFTRPLQHLSFTPVTCEASAVWF